MSQFPRRRALLDKLEQTATAIYVIDVEDRVVFLNQACRDWLGKIAVQLVGKPCTLAGEDEVATTLRSLAPPSEVRSGQIVVTKVACPGRASLPPFRFLAIGTESNQLILAESGATLPPAPSAALEDYARLREKILSLRARQPKVDRWPFLLGEDWVTVQARAKLEIAAASWSHVLFIGPRGSGAERMARALHAHHGELAGPLSEIEGPLMDAELLEFSAGNILAHLDEDRQRRATLLIKQVGSLAEDAAERLRFWLDQFPHLRCLCTAEKPLSNLAPALGTRLGTLQVNLPKLTERVGDLPLLLAAQLQRQQGLGARTEGFARETLDHLCAYPWPGDFEEMEQAIRHAVRVCPQGSIQLDHLPLQIRSWSPQNSQNHNQRRMPPIELDRILSKIEADLIQQTLIDCQQNRTEAASRLGISRARLLRRISELKLSPESTEATPQES